jgi:hypothetical protein
MYAVGTLTQAALLSGVPKRERTSDSKGGLLRELGHFGFLVAKDFTSVLSMGRDARAPLLAALREIADGHWTRDVGADGGRHLSWSGKAVFLAGVTPIIDQHHAVIAAMGERFILSRLPLVDELEQARFAIQRSEKEKIARSELRTAVRRLFSSLQPIDRLDDSTVERLTALSTLTAKCRSAVERDPYRREIDLIPASERPARLAIALKRVLLGMTAIGVPTDHRWTLLQSLALDCLPQLRRKILTYLVKLPPESWADTSSISIALDYPTTTVRRGLEDLAGHGIVVRSKSGKGKSDTWQISSYCRDLVKTAFPDGTIPDNSDARPPTNPKA